MNTYIIYPTLMGLALGFLVWTGDRPRRQRIWLAPIMALMGFGLLLANMWLAPPEIPLRHWTPKPHYVYHIEVLP